MLKRSRLFSSNISAGGPKRSCGPRGPEGGKMSGFFRSKLLSAMCTSVLCFGVMVVIVEEGPQELPYYDGTLKAPLTSPMVEQLYGGQPATAADSTDDYGTADQSETYGAAQAQDQAQDQNQNQDQEYDTGATPYEAGVDAEATSYEETNDSSYTSRAE